MVKRFTHFVIYSIFHTRWNINVKTATLLILMSECVPVPGLEKNHDLKKI